MRKHAPLPLALLLFSLAAFFIFPRSSQAILPEEAGLKEGDVIGAISDDPDIFIVNAYGFKRLFLNPIIFRFYGHLGGFVSVKRVAPEIRDGFVTSGLFRNCETGDQRIWALEMTGDDTGILHHVDVYGSVAAARDPDFFKKVFCMNTNEFNWYPKGSPYTSLDPVITLSADKTVGPAPLYVTLTASLQNMPLCGPFTWNFGRGVTRSGSLACTTGEPAHLFIGSRNVSTTHTFNEYGYYITSASFNGTISKPLDIFVNAAPPVSVTPVPQVIVTPVATPYPAGDRLISIVDFAFSPHRQEIVRGGKVRFVNISHKNFHTTTQDSGLWDSGSMEKYEGTFILDTSSLTAGATYRYHCAFHPWMVGELTVY